MFWTFIWKIDLFRKTDNLNMFHNYYVVIVIKIQQNRPWLFELRSFQIKMICLWLYRDYLYATLTFFCAYIPNMRAHSTEQFKSLWSTYLRKGRRNWIRNLLCPVSLFHLFVETISGCRTLYSSFLVNLPCLHWFDG